MAGLGETTARLVSARRALRGSTAPSAGGAMTEVRGFGFNPGALRMMTYVPADLPPGAPLVVVLHGCGQDAAGYAQGAGWLTLADRLGFAVLAPQQERGNNPNGCFNWFEPGDSGRSLGEAASIHAMVEHILNTRRLDTDRVFVTGLSAAGPWPLSCWPPIPRPSPPARSSRACRSGSRRTSTRPSAPCAGPRG